MKKKASILFTSLATFFLLASVILPHFHHHGDVCLALTLCQHQNDTDTDHEEDCDQFCITHTQYLASQTNEKYKATYPQSHINPLQQEGVLWCCLYHKQVPLASSLQKRIQNSEVEQALLYKQAELQAFHGLRAPPSFYI